MHETTTRVTSKSRPPLARQAVAVLVFAVSMFVPKLLEPGMSAPLRLAIALLPVPAFLFFVWAQVQWYKQADEMWQRILLITWVHAFVACVLGALILYELQKAGFFPHSEYPTLEYFGDVLPYSFLAGVVVGYYRAIRRYR